MGYFTSVFDIGREVLRLPARQHYVHPGVRIEQRKCQHFWSGRKFSCDHFKRRGISHVSPLGRRDHMARDAPCFREASTVIRVRSERSRSYEKPGQHQSKAQHLHRTLCQAPSADPPSLGTGKLSGN
jgi:hypothetical protein